MSAGGADSAALVAELHRRQAAMYGGGAVQPVAELLTEDIVWHVPGSSPIAGEHRGIDAVLAYFERRRSIAAGTMRMRPGAAVSEGHAFAQFVGGEAVLDGERVSWQTVGVYRLSAGSIAEVWLVPLDLELFDRIWGGGAAGGRPS
jgi:ketosteroid isomerase-like protein